VWSGSRQVRRVFVREERWSRAATDRQAHRQAGRQCMETAKKRKDGLDATDNSWMQQTQGQVQGQARLGILGVLEAMDLRAAGARSGLGRSEEIEYINRRC
jgi:hypothetical protein